MAVTVHLPWDMVVFNYLQDVITVLGVELVEGVFLYRERAVMAAVALTGQASEAVGMMIVVTHCLHSVEAEIDREEGIEDAMTTLIVVIAEMVTAGIEDGVTTAEFLWVAEEAQLGASDPMIVITEKEEGIGIETEEMTTGREIAVLV